MELETLTECYRVLNTTKNYFGDVEVYGKIGDARIVCAALGGVLVGLKGF